MSAAVYRKVPVKSKLFDHDHASHARFFTGFLWDIWWEPGLLFRHWPMRGDGCAGPPEPSMRQPGPTCLRAVCLTHGLYGAVPRMFSANPRALTPSPKNASSVWTAREVITAGVADARNATRMLGTGSRPTGSVNVQPLFNYHESRCDPQSVRVYDATGA